MKVKVPVVDWYWHLTVTVIWGTTAPVCTGYYRGCQNFRHLELSSRNFRHTVHRPSLAINAGSLLSRSEHIFESNPIITWNLRHTMAYIDIHHEELSSHYWMSEKVC